MRTAVFLLIGSMGLAQAPSLDGLTGFKTKAELDAIVAKFQSGELNRAQLLFGRDHGAYHAGINRISGRHIAEMHMNKDEFFVVLAGSATMTVGGTLTDAKPRSALDPSEVRGVAITGGKSQKISAGDVISVPFGTPHEINPGNGEIVYICVTMFGQLPPVKKPSVDQK